MDIYAVLDRHGIAYERVDHPPVYTCEQARELVPPLPGREVKNLFLRDKKGRRHFLVVVGYDKSVDLKSLSKVLEAPGLTMGSPERLGRYLGVEPGSVTVLAAVNDVEAAVEVVFDADLQRLLAVTGHAVSVVAVPAREPA